MSTRTYIIYDYGYVIDSKEGEKIAQQMFDDEYANEFDLCQLDYICYEDDFEGDLNHITDDGKISYSSVSISTSLIYMPIPESPRMFGESPYKDKHDLVRQMRERYSEIDKYLPQDDDEYFKHIYHICGTGWG